jgi:putative two-component system response regulator
MDPMLEQTGSVCQKTPGGNGDGNGRSLVLVVDDDTSIRRGLAYLLNREGYSTLEAADGGQALDLVRDERPDLILLDMMMPHVSGLEVCRQIKGGEETRLIPVVMITAVNNPDDKIAAIEAGADDFLNKPVNLAELRARVRSLLRMKHLNDLLERADMVIASLANAIEAKDKYTEGHNERVSLYSVALAKAIGLGLHDLALIRMAGVLHDIGKIGVPDSILNKEGPLEATERERIFTHPDNGGKILKPLRSLAGVREVVLSHHERYDGNGYPRGLSGDGIPLLARIVSIADSYDAMTTTRSYRKALSRETALTELRRNAGRMWDPGLVEAFVSLAEAGGLDSLIPDRRDGDA